MEMTYREKRINSLNMLKMQGGNINDMASKIYDLCSNPSFYKSQSQKAIENSPQFSIEKQKERLLQEILCSQK